MTKAEMFKNSFVAMLRHVGEVLSVSAIAVVMTLMVAKPAMAEESLYTRLGGTYNIA